MNLFENLQKLNESENPLISEFKEFLASKNAQYIANEIGETKDGMQIVIYDGDWKHEHLYMKRLLDEFFTEKGIDISINSEEIGESDQDTYSVRYNVEFNAKPKEYNTNLIPIRLVKEDIENSENETIEEVIEPSNFSPDGRCYYDDPSDWKEKHEWVANKLEAAGYKCKGQSHWKSMWTNGNPKEDIEIDYWMDFDVIQEIVYLCLRDINTNGKTVTESVDINLDDYEYVGPATGYNKGWSLYRKIVDGKGVWVAEHQTSGEIKSITYDQVQGFEPIKLDGIKKLQKDLGDMLLPKRESNDEDYDDNASTFLYTLEAEVKEAAHKFMLSVGFPEDEADDYLLVSTDINDDYVMVSVGAELGYESISNLCDELNKVIEKHDKDAYFEPECPGRIVAYLFGEKAKQVHKEKEQALKDKINSLTETNHINIDDRDYATGEEMYNEFVKYLNSLDQIAMNGNDCNWEPTEFNAKNLNADGEIYLECGAYILIYPYINEWAEDYYKVLIVDAEACDLDIQLKNGIEKIFNKFKTDKWKLEFEG